VRFTAADEAADERLRVVDLHRERVVLRRSVRGIRMALNMPVASYRGVAIRLSGETGKAPTAIAVATRLCRCRCLRPPSATTSSPNGKAGAASSACRCSSPKATALCANRSLDWARCASKPQPGAAAAVAPSPSAGFSISAPCAGQAAGNSDRASRRTRDHRAELKRERSVLRLPASPCTPTRIFASLAFLVACVTPALAGAGSGVASDVLAQRAKSFTDSIGMVYPNTVGYASGYPALSNMGVTVVRASIPIPGESGTIFNNNYLAAHGIRFNFIWLNGFGNFPVTNCANIATTVARIISLEATFVATYPGAMLANEGVNETNNFGVCYTNSAVATGSNGAIINFATVPADLVTAANATYTDPGTIHVGAGFTVTDITTPAAIPSNTTIVSATSTSVTLSASTTVKGGDTIQFQAQGVEPSPNVIVAASSLGWQAAIYNATHADQTLTGAGVNVANYTGYIYGATPNPPSVPGTADYNTFHFYTNLSYIQPTAYTGEPMAAFFNPANQPIAGLQTVVTETGWYSAASIKASPFHSPFWFGVKATR